MLVAICPPLFKFVRVSSNRPARSGSVASLIGWSLTCRSGTATSLGTEGIVDAQSTATTDKAPLTEASWRGVSAAVTGYARSRCR